MNPLDKPERVNSDDAEKAVTEAAFTTEDGRRVIHCRIGVTGADWDLSAVLEAIRGADRCAWRYDSLGHELWVKQGQRILKFDVQAPPHVGGWWS